MQTALLSASSATPSYLEMSLRIRKLISYITTFPSQATKGEIKRVLYSEWIDPLWCVELTRNCVTFPMVNNNQNPLTNPISRTKFQHQILTIRPQTKLVECSGYLPRLQTCRPTAACTADCAKQAGKTSSNTLITVIKYIIYINLLGSTS